MTLTGCDVPSVFVAVIDTELMASVVPPDTASVTVAENWLPTLCDAAVWYQLANADVTSVVRLVPCTFAPDAGVI